MALELARPSLMGIIKFATGEGSYSVEKNLKDDVLNSLGESVDARLRAGSFGFQLQFRTSDTGRLRYAFKSGEVTKATDGIYWTSKANEPVGETKLSVDVGNGKDGLNIYIASSVASQVVEVRIWNGYQ